MYHIISNGFFMSSIVTFHFNWIFHVMSEKRILAVKQWQRWHQLISTGHPSNFVCAGDRVSNFQINAGCGRQSVGNVGVTTKSVQCGHELWRTVEGSEIMRVRVRRGQGMIWYGLQVISYRRFHVTVLPTRHQKMALFIREMPGIRCLNEI